MKALLNIVIIQMSVQGKVSKYIHPLNKVIEKITLWMGFVAACILGVMMLLNVSDVTGRYVFNRPIFAIFELIGLLLLFVMTWGMALCELRDGHIKVQFLVSRLPFRVQEVIDSMTHLITLGIFAVITWQLFVRGITLAGLTLTEASEELGIPFAPFYMAMGISTGMFCITILINLIRHLAKAVQC